MQRLLPLALLFLTYFCAPLHATTAPDATLVLGLQTCVANGIDAGVRTWYVDREDVGAAMSAKVLTEAAKFGSLTDYEVVASQAIAKRVTRYYVALYFTRGPLWIRIDRYDGRDKEVFLPLKCSSNPDEILPGYVTEFYH